ncbi:MAG: HEAT repeat domain-containing protein [Pirellula sp.]
MPNVVGATIGCCAVLLVLYTWPQWSAAWLRTQWSNQLTNASTDEALAVIMALRELGSEGTPSIVRQLNDVDPEKRTVAFSALSENIDASKSVQDGVSQLLAIASELKSNAPQSAASKLLHDQLAFKILDTAPKSSRLYSNIESLCTSITGTETNNSLQETQHLIPKVPKPSESFPSDAGPMRVTVPGPTRLTDWSTENVPLPSVPAPVREIPNASIEPIKTQSGKTKAVAAKLSDVSMVSSNSPPASSVSFAPVRLVSNNRIADTVPAIEMTNSLSSEVQGLEKIPLEQLFPMLGSTQDRRVGMVYEELNRRGVTDPIINRAIDLARGDSQQRLAALEEIIRSDAMNPLPLLVWMAQTNDRPVRQRAIAILGSMQDPEAMRRLRELVHREPDQYLQQQIQQALVAGGYANR